MEQIYSDLPEWMQAVIITEAIVLNVCIIAGIGVIAWLKFQIFKYKRMTESEQERQHDLIRQINKKLQHDE